MTKLKVVIKVLNLTEENYNLKCEIHGLAVYSINRKSTEESGSACFPSIGIYKERNIYSKTNVSLLVLYNFKDYGQLKLTIDLSITHCDVNKINICIAWRKVHLFTENSSCTIHQFIHNLTIKTYEKYIRRGCNFCPIKHMQYHDRSYLEKKTVQINITGYMIGK